MLTQADVDALTALLNHPAVPGMGGVGRAAIDVLPRLTVTLPMHEAALAAVQADIAKLTADIKEMPSAAD